MKWNGRQYAAENDDHLKLVISVEQSGLAGKRFLIDPTTEQAQDAIEELLTFLSIAKHVRESNG